MNNNFISGEWSGFYIEPYRDGRGWMHLYLSFENGQIRGEGTDYVGPWVATGSYDETTGDCRWTKQYIGLHKVDYVGKCGEKGIQGTWTILSEGPFHIWPKSLGHFNELYLREELETPSGTGSSILLDSDLEPQLV